MAVVAVELPDALDNFTVRVQLVVHRELHARDGCHNYFTCRTFCEKPVAIVSSGGVLAARALRIVQAVVAWLRELHRVHVLLRLLAHRAVDEAPAHVAVGRRLRRTALCQALVVRSAPAPVVSGEAVSFAMQAAALKARRHVDAPAGRVALRGLRRLAARDGEEPRGGEEQANAPGSSHERERPKLSHNGSSQNGYGYAGLCVVCLSDAHNDGWTDGWRKRERERERERASERERERARERERERKEGRLGGEDIESTHSQDLT